MKEILSAFLGILIAYTLIAIILGGPIFLSFYFKTPWFLSLYIIVIATISTINELNK